MYACLITLQVLLMNWYISKIVFRIATENPQEKFQFDEQLRLISADSTEEAFHKAKYIGIREEDTFMNDQNKAVRWEFINVSEVISLGSLQDGTEVYSQLHEPEEATRYIRTIHQRAIGLRLKEMAVN